jgi:predicted O-methyltransferase YrrM
MPIARTYDAAIGKVVTTVRDAYLDRLSRWSDIQEYLPFLHETAASYPQVRVLELGSRRGNSTLAFLAAALTVRGSVVSADLDPVDRYSEGMLRWRDCPWWTFIRGDDMDPTVQSLLPARCDVLFVDTSHEYRHTLAELRAYMPRVAPGGVALFHDTRIFGCWSQPGDTIPPVARALNDYCAETGLSWENLEGEYGMGVIRVGEPAAV